jgi:hypothetical protein
VEQILLSVATPGTKVFGGETVEALEFDVAAREVKLAQGLHNPDVDREGGLIPVGKQKDAISDFAAHAGQFYQLSTGSFDAYMTKFFEIDFTIGHGSSSSKEVRSAEPHFAGAQVMFGGAGKTRSRGKGPGGIMTGKDG